MPRALLSVSDKTGIVDLGHEVGRHAREHSVDLAWAAALSPAALDWAPSAVARVDPRDSSTRVALAAELMKKLPPEGDPGPFVFHLNLVN